MAAASDGAGPGPAGATEFDHDPGRAWELWESPQDYAFITEPQEHSRKTSVSWPRGKVLGGSSALNGMIYVRGARADYDKRFSIISMTICFISGMRSILGGRPGRPRLLVQGQSAT